jgi:hypothetical protein
VPGRVAAEAQAVQAKKAVSWRSSLGSLTTSRASPPFLSGPPKYLVQYST